VAAAAGTASGWKPDPERIGATLPLADPEEGVLMWDPAGFCKGDEATFDRYREAEVKHGRVAMLAVVGLVVQHYAHIKYFIMPDGVTPMDDVPNGLGALTSEPGGQGFAILVLLAGIVELGVLKAPEGSKPWEFGDPAGFREFMVDMDDATLKSYEIEHGRLAMLGFIGAVMAECLTGYDAVDQWGYWRLTLSNFNQTLY
jgi:hypothetical protein